MPSTSVHLPADLLAALDELAAREQIPRNRIIVQALREAVDRRARRWPDGYFSGDHLSARDLETLQSGAAEFDRTVRQGRRSRTRRPF